MIRSLLLIVTTILLSGCIHQEKRIILNKDGSGRVESTIYLSGAMMNFFQGFIQDSTTTPEEAMVQKAEEDAIAFVEKSGGGLAFKEVVALSENGKSGYKTVYTFDDVSKVRVPYNDMDGKFDPESTKDIVLFKRNESTVTVVIPREEPKQDSAITVIDTSEKTEVTGDTVTIDSATQEMQRQMMMSMLNGLRFNIVIEVNDEFNSSASHVDSSTITLFDLNFEAMVSSPESLDILSKMTNPGKEEFEEVNSIPGISIETKDQFTITFQ